MRGETEGEAEAAARLGECLPEVVGNHQDGAAKQRNAPQPAAHAHDGQEASDNSQRSNGQAAGRGGGIRPVCKQWQLGANHQS